MSNNPSKNEKRSPSQEGQSQGGQGGQSGRGPKTPEEQKAMEAYEHTVEGARKAAETRKARGIQTGGARRTGEGQDQDEKQGGANQKGGNQGSGQK